MYKMCTPRSWPFFGAVLHTEPGFILNNVLTTEFHGLTKTLSSLLSRLDGGRKNDFFVADTTMYCLIFDGPLSL